MAKNKLSQLTSKEKIQEAIDNINRDRELTQQQLSSVLKLIEKDTSRYESLGSIVAKYLESLQRSNEQLVKCAAILAKKETGEIEETNMSIEELEAVYDETANVTNIVPMRTK